LLLSVVPLTRTAAPVVDPAPPADQPTPGFAAALADASARSGGPALPARLDPTRLPSVSLGTMVEALAAAPGSATLPVEAAAPLTEVGAVRAAGAPPSGASSAILAAGERYLGVPYRWGGTDPASGFDCSGFVQRVFADLGVSLPRVSVDQAKAGTAVASLAEARPGDLVFWYADGKRPNHIGIYAGEGRMLVAPRTGDVVRYQDLSRTPHEIRRVT
jgi:peptidoglycan DL-endopeptidase CwlO